MCFQSLQGGLLYQNSALDKILCSMATFHSITSYNNLSVNRFVAYSTEVAPYDIHGTLPIALPEEPKCLLHVQNLLRHPFSHKCALMQYRTIEFFDPDSTNRQVELLRERELRKKRLGGAHMVNFEPSLLEKKKTQEICSTDIGISSSGEFYLSVIVVLQKVCSFPQSISVVPEARLEVLQLPNGHLDLEHRQLGIQVLHLHHLLQAIIHLRTRTPQYSLSKLTLNHASKICQAKNSEEARVACR